MDFLWDKITEWLKEMLIGGIVSNLSGMFDATNQKVAEISGQVGLSPQAWNGSIFNMIQNLSETVIVPIAGAILAFVMTLELIQLITDKNNLNDMDTWIFFKWAFKSAAAVLIVTNTSSANVKPGDLVFFTGTYDTPGVSHVGIYVGNNMMIHCGDPISYANLNSSYWQSHFYRYGRLP